MKQLIMFLIVNNVSVPNMTYLASFSLNISNEKTKIGLLVKALDPQSNGPVLKTTVLLQGRGSLSSFRG